jgi:hypothetical protein
MTRRTVVTGDHLKFHFLSYSLEQQELRKNEAKIKGKICRYA